MKKHRNITMPQWIKEAVRENGFVAAVVGLEEAAAWDLRPNPPLSSGAVPERTVPAAVLNPIKAELEQKLAEQQKYMALIIEQNEQLLQQDAARRQQAEEMNELRLQTDDALNQIGSLRNQLEVERQLREQPDGDAARPWWKFWNN